MGLCTSTATLYLALTDTKACGVIRSVRPSGIRPLQEIQAPIVLDSLNCNGTEERLVDCPGATETYPDYAYYYTDLTGGCSSVSAQFARVACGTLTAPGVSGFP